MYFAFVIWCKRLTYFLLAITLGHSLQANDVNGNIERGKKLFNQCKACHSLTKTNRPRLGPDLADLFSRHAGTHTTYQYSAALVEADFVWSAERLNEWLAKPNSFLPGNKMPYAGMRSAKDRQDLIAYLKKATQTPIEE